MEALIYLVDHDEATTDDLLQFIKGPDFPTGGLVFNDKDIKHACATGRGGVVMRGETEIIETKNGVYQIVITSIPYQVNKASLIMKIADLVHEKKIEGIKDIRDESTTLANMRIVIDLKSGAYPQKIVNALYKNTELETVFHYNMLALVGGVPKLLSLHGLASEFVAHRQDMIVRRSRFDLKRAQDREHILLGLKRAVDIIDEIIQTIRKSADGEEAKVNLIKKFKFTELQAVAILEMRLQRLAGLEIKKILEELGEQQALIKELTELLANPAKVKLVVKKEFVELRDKYRMDRRTKVIHGGIKEISNEDLVPETENILVVTAGGYVKRTDPSEYRQQRRGGVGVVDLNIKEEDFVTNFLSANTHSDLLFFTNKGKAYQLKMYELPEGKRATRGKSIMNFLPLADEEKITSILPVPKAVKGKSLSIMFITRDGVAKKVALGDFEDVRRSGIIAIKLGTGDALLSVLLVNSGDEVIVASAAGQAIRFKEKDIREMGRAAAGVRAIKLGKSDAVIGAGVITPEGKSGEILVMMENGFGKMTKLSEYKVQNRGGSGIKTAQVTSKTGKLIEAKVITNPEVEIVAISKQSQVIRTSLKDIPTLGRQTQGVKIMKLRTGDVLASVTLL
jgi:DNA gyrase subunit A